MLHLLLTIITCDVWLIVWIFISGSKTEAALKVEYTEFFNRVNYSVVIGLAPIPHYL